MRLIGGCLSLMVIFLLFLVGWEGGCAEIVSWQTSFTGQSES